MATTAKERPILFKPEMVKAILEGRKTQTRRVVKFKPQEFVDEIDAGKEVFWTDKYGDFHSKPCPYGKVGDRLWVRETFSPDAKKFYPFQIAYKADNDFRSHDFENGQYVERFPDGKKQYYDFRWRPSIHMPRKVSRIDLKIKDIRVERLCDISEEDALAEGFKSTAVLTEDKKDYHGLYASEHFLQYVREINGLEYGDNPWVWVIEFERIK